VIGVHLRAAAVRVLKAGPHDALGVDDPLHVHLRVVGPADVALDDRALRLRDVARGAELRPAHPQGGRVLELPEHLRHRAAGGREQELVEVDEGQPARLVAVRLDAVEVALGLRGEVRAVAGPVLHHHRSLVDVRGEHLEVVVAAEVVVEEEALDADELVELDPLGQIRSLVPVDGADRQVYRRLLHARGRI
jgi:hypothetical protein